MCADRLMSVRLREHDMCCLVQITPPVCPFMSASAEDLAAHSIHCQDTFPGVPLSTGSPQSSECRYGVKIRSFSGDRPTVCGSPTLFRPDHSEIASYDLAGLLDQLRMNLAHTPLQAGRSTRTIRRSKERHASQFGGVHRFLGIYPCRSLTGS